MNQTDLIALWLTLKLATVTTILLLLIATPLAWWLTWTNTKLSRVVSSLANLSLVLPPTVLGFYLLLLLGPNGPIGWITTYLGLGRLPFTFWGLVIGSMIYSLPFALQPLQNAFANLGARPLEVAATLRAGPIDRFFTIAIPLAWPGFVTAIVLVFAHTVGEFGVVLMLGGNIPGTTQVVSVAIYNHVEALEYNAAHWLAGLLTIFSFMTLLILSFIQQRPKI
ncbi:molybdenum ABC transporter permease [Achromatium sp. WMS3]|nr:molybdenum ABC transporter permease [Achromatium sp. WMS3]